MFSAAKVHVVSTNGTQSEYEIDAGNGTCVNVTVGKYIHMYRLSIK